MNKGRLKQSRRTFLKKNLLGTVFITAYGSLFPLSGLFTREKQAKDFGSDLLNESDRDFLLPNDKVYLNTSSLGPSLRTVVEGVCENWNQLEVNGYDGKQLTKKAKSRIAAFFKTPPENIALTRNTTEGINIAAQSIPFSKGDEVILSTHEHVGCAAIWLMLEKEKGIVVKLLELDLTGESNLDRLRNLITPKTKAVVLSHVCCTTGMILPIKEITSHCRKNQIFSVIDGAQAAGMLPIDLSDIQADFYACAAHKWAFGPKGIGMLYINPFIMNQLQTVFVGANSDAAFNLKQKKLVLRGVADQYTYGTRNVSLLKGWQIAIDWNDDLGIETVAKRTNELKQTFLDSIQAEYFELLSPSNEWATSILTFRIKGKGSQRIVNQLRSQFKIYTRYIYENNLDAIRVSFAIFNTTAQVKLLKNALEELMQEEED